MNFIEDMPLYYYQDNQKNQKKVFEEFKKTVENMKQNGIVEQDFNRIKKNYLW